MRNGDSKKAFEDIDKALEIEPDMPSAISARASLHLDAGEIDAAMSEVERAVLLEPKSGAHVALRGTIRHIKGDLDGAVADYREAAKLDPTEPFDSLLMFLALAEGGRVEEARAELRNLLTRWPADEWPAPLAHRLLGEISDAELLKAAQTGTEVLRKYQDFDWHFYLGASAMIAGDKDRARAYLERVVDTDMRQFLEYNIARLFMERLGGKAYLSTN
jgi:lipoprotein NlpI